MTDTLADWLAPRTPGADQGADRDAFFGRHTIWGTDHGDAFAGLAKPFDPSGTDRELAYAIHHQLDSRITTQRLALRSGDEKTALKSVFGLFAHARTAVEARGPEARQVADIVWWMLNRDVRPFTARWHGAATKGSLRKADTQRRFRAELEHLRNALRAWSSLLRSIVDGGPVARVPPTRAPKPRAFATDLPSRDGFAVPTAFTEAFAEMVAAERPFVEAWRARLERPALGDADSILTGIAISGGGIRSATFALGVLRQIARRVDIFGVDYLSTVSGGGYVGSLVTSAYHHGLAYREALGRGPLAEGLAPAVIGWLRGQSDVMRYDAELVADLAGRLFEVGADAAADVYRQRLEQTWLVRPDASDEAKRFGLVVQGGEDIGVSALNSDKRPGPLQIWNMAINATEMTPRMESALRSRGADLYTVSRAGAECRLLGYAAEPGWTVGRAMALSGAACAPNTGETAGDWKSRLAGTFANLGGWVDHFDGEQKKPGLLARIKALLGTNEVAENVAFLSDGGHVENTGAYALLRRRCGTILLIDGEEDAEMRFHGLVELQHLARVELGVDLDVDTTELELNPQGLSDAHYACIPIEYPALTDGTPAHQGILLYVKLSMTGDEPRYVQSFRENNPVFPHHGTIRYQGFDDKMFEAYLALGEHVGAELVSEPLVGPSVPAGFEHWVGQVAHRLMER